MLLHPDYAGREGSPETMPMVQNSDLLMDATPDLMDATPDRASSDTAATTTTAVGRTLNLARHYRPARFDQVIGQSVAVRILTNAFTGERTPQAFILCGPHGTGKTTLARLIARAFDCSQRLEDSAEPCGECDSCKAFTDERHPDILEIDAASHTSVDHVREITDAVQYRPILSKYKVYIIDEVHMLSKPAFNALLKTLEEPPDHTVFLFATTEIEKVPVTILSRCQRLELARVDQDLLARHILDIAAREKATLDDGAGRLIALSSAGSVRDALSLLEAAMIHAGSDSINEAVIRDMTGRADGRAVQELCDGLLSGDVQHSIERFSTLCAKGAQPVRILDDVLAALHQQCLERTIQGPSKRTIQKTAQETSKKTAKGPSKGKETHTIAALQRMWQILFKGVGDAKRAGNAQQAAEMAIIRAAYGALLPDLDALIEAVRMRNIGGGSSSSPPSSKDSSSQGQSAQGQSAQGQSAQGQVAQKQSAQGQADDIMEKKNGVSRVGPRTDEGVRQGAGQRTDARADAGRYDGTDARGYDGRYEGADEGGYDGRYEEQKDDGANRRPHPHPHPHPHPLVTTFLESFPEAKKVREDS